MSAAAHNFTSAPSGGLRILFVDDSPDERELFAVRIATEVVEVVTANSVAEALAELERGETDLVVTDLILPDHDGYELLGRMRAMPPEYGAAVPVLAASGWVDERDRADALAAGFSGFLAKPYENSALLDAVARVTPEIEELRRLRARVAGQRDGLRKMREQLAARASGLRDERARMALKYGGAGERAAAKQVLIESAAQACAESHFGSPDVVLKVVGTTYVDGDRESWAVVASHRNEVFHVNVVVEPGARILARPLLGPVLDRT